MRRAMRVAYLTVTFLVPMLLIPDAMGRAGIAALGECLGSVGIFYALLSGYEKMFVKCETIEN